jgi:hypothetical protein
MSDTQGVLASGVPPAPPQSYPQFIRKIGLVVFAPQGAPLGQGPASVATRLFRNPPSHRPFRTAATTASTSRRCT